MKEQMKERGITLVALVVTIIILLILAGVTLNIALKDNGLFNKTKEAVDKYKSAEEDEESALNVLAERLENININYNNYIGAYVDGYKPTVKEIKISKDTTGINSKIDANNNVIENMDENKNQIFKTEEQIKWRIWDYDENTKVLRLISDTSTTQKLALNDATGYNNGVYAINEICRQCYGQYKEDGKMKDGISVANLRRSDIEKISKYNFTKYKHKENDFQEVIDDNNEGEKLIKYGETKTYTNGVIAPKIWIEHDSKWSYAYDETTGNSKKDAKTGNPWEEEFNYTDDQEIGNGTLFKQSYYVHDYKNEEFENEEYFNLIFGDEIEKNIEPYWLGTRMVLLWKIDEYGYDVCDYSLGVAGLFFENYHYISGDNIFRSNKLTYAKTYGLRPIVSINLRNSNFNLKKIYDETSGKVSFELYEN